jgi:hypothetical protein
LLVSFAFCCRRTSSPQQGMETWLCCPRSNGQGRFATVYNTLHQFTEAGLLRQVAIDSSRSYFDTNNTEHHHYYLEDRHELIDNLLSLLARPTPKALTSTSSLCAPILLGLALYRRRAAR